MGQKVHPIGIRLGITKTSDSCWYAEDDYAANLLSDIKVREHVEKKLADAGIGKIEIKRPAKNAIVTIHAAKPGIIIGQKGRGAEVIRDEVSKIMGVPVHVNIKEIRKPELVAKIVGDTVCRQLEQRVMFRRAMKRAVSGAMRQGAKGIKICVSGRLGGAEIARSEWYREGRVPLHTFRADIDYAHCEANTTYGVIGVKVWIFKGERLSKSNSEEEVTSKNASS